MDDEQPAAPPHADEDQPSARPALAAGPVVVTAVLVIALAAAVWWVAGADERLRSRAAAGDAFAMVLLAQGIEAGRIEPSPGAPNQVETLLLSAAEAGHADAMYEVASRSRAATWRGPAVVRPDVLLRGAAERGHPRAAVLSVENALAGPPLTEEDEARLYGFLDLADQRGLTTATPLRTRLDGRRAQRIEREQRIEQLTSRARGGDPEAQFELGRRYLEGDEVPKDPGFATTWWRQAADGGHREAAYKMGLFAEHGQADVQRSITVAARYYERAADLGHAKAAYDLGKLYYYARHAASRASWVDDARGVPFCISRKAWREPLPSPATRPCAVDQEQVNFRRVPRGSGGSAKLELGDPNGITKKKRSAATAATPQAATKKAPSSASTAASRKAGRDLVKAVAGPCEGISIASSGAVKGGLFDKRTYPWARIRNSSNTTRYVWVSYERQQRFWSRSVLENGWGWSAAYRNFKVPAGDIVQVDLTSAGTEARANGDVRIDSCE